MGYEEMSIHAIQDKTKTCFAERYRIYGNKGERDRSWDFMTKNSTPQQLRQLSPVTLKVIAKTEDVQLDLFEKGVVASGE